MESKKEIVGYLNNISLFLLGILFLVFPVFVLSQTTEPTVLPKQAIIIGFSLLILVLQAVKMLLEKVVKFRRTPFDIPLIFFSVAIFISTLLAVNRIDALTAFVPFFFVILSFFIITNVVKDKGALVFFRACLVTGAVVLSILNFLSYFKIYLLPFVFAHTPSFSAAGSILDSTIYLLLAFFIAVIPGIKAIQKKSPQRGETTGLLIASFLILLGFSVTIYQLIIQFPIILPYATGFQTAFSAISQDTGRIVQGFLFGSGFGTFNSDFSRFKVATFNYSPLWSITFFRSSSFILELLATTGVLGIVSFVYLFYQIVKTKPLSIPLILAIIGIIFLPFSFVNLALFFAILGLFAAEQGIRHSNKHFDIELQLVTFKKGLIAFEASEPERKKIESKILPIVIFVIFIAFIAVSGYFSTRFFLANLKFQEAVIASNQSNGVLAYQDQSKALSLFSENDVYQRVFSQTNLILASNLALAIKNQGKTPDAQTSQTIYSLIQQSINSARQATLISPQTSLDWENLAAIYRNLIGFGQNADQFALLSQQQAILLDPNNPQLYVEYGGIYYQLGNWDKAIQAFQMAENLKSDFSNAYYNHGHALEQKGDYKNALIQYQIVKNLVANDPTNLSKITGEINVLQNKVNGQTETAKQAQATPEKQNIEVNTPAAQLPPQNPPVKIPAPKTTITPEPTQALTPTPAQ